MISGVVVEPDFCESVKFLTLAVHNKRHIFTPDQNNAYIIVHSNSTEICEKRFSEVAVHIKLGMYFIKFVDDYQVFEIRTDTSGDVRKAGQWGQRAVEIQMRHICVV